MKKISVVILAYNEEKGIAKCIDSILNQLHKAHEIIVINDGSTDSTLNILKKYKNKIKIIDKKKNEGRAKAYTAGFKKAKGNVVAFIDGDSYAPRNWITLLAQAFEKCAKNTACLGGNYLCANTQYKLSNLENKYNKIAMKKSLFKLPSGTNMAYDKKICTKLNVFKNIPQFRCDRYAMDLLIRKGYIAKTIPGCYVFSKSPKSLRGYFKQRFRWGRGAPSARMLKTSVLFQKTVLILFPAIIVAGVIIFPHIFFPLIGLTAVLFLLSGLIMSIRWKILSFIEALQLILLKLAGCYAYAAGYVFQTMRRVI
ncbi:glycosyltransferase family 2 protein [Candidatus Woesearchaeota archaeon]|nr:glycosyltransferase family 2 protein [Candidatus Woesearchaeota archaeon]